MLPNILESPKKVNAYDSIPASTKKERLNIYDNANNGGTGVGKKTDIFGNEVPSNKSSKERGEGSQQKQDRTSTSGVSSGASRTSGTTTLPSATGGANASFSGIQSKKQQSKDFYPQYTTNPNFQWFADQKNNLAIGLQRGLVIMDLSVET